MEEKIKRAALAKNKKGFTFIELLIVLTILSILVGAVILSIGNVFDTARKTAYTQVKRQIRDAVIGYSAGHSGDFPLTGDTTVIDDKTLGIIDICALLTRNNPSGLLGEMPDGCILYPESDNCDSQIFNCSCDVEAHYIWAIDATGNVYSSCINTAANGGGCENTGQDGFQSVWP